MKKLEMQLFGSFRLDSGEAVLGEGSLRSSKSIRLLAYLLINRDHMLPHQQLIEVFWGNDTKKPEGALKTLMYRIRNELKVLGDETYICTCSGGYRWNPEIEVVADYEQFEKMAAKLKRTKDAEERENLCREIISSYRGNVSAKIADELWILPKVTWYRSIYMDTVNRLCGMLKEKQKWEEMEVLCNQAMCVDSLDEDTHSLLLAALCGQKKYGLALTQYKKSKQLFYENMGIQIPEKIQKTFQAMMPDGGEKLMNIRKLLKDVEEQEKPVGVFFCDYQIFRKIYQMEVRRIERIGIAEFIALFTVRKSDGIWQKPDAAGSLAEGMKILEGSIRKSLRVGDVAAKYSPTQMIVLLPICTFEDGRKVAERIRKKFEHKIRDRKLELEYDLAELSASKS